MIAEILSIGTELLMGQIINSDAAFIARKLPELGIDTYYQQTVGDNEKRMLEAIALAASRSDIVFLTGGLGPTQDDMTKQVLAKYLGLPMVEDSESKQTLINWFKGRNAKITQNNFRQAEFPQGAIILKNDWGTAPGCIVQHSGKHFIILPGPPRELEPMMDVHIVPYLSSLSGDRIVSHMLKVFGIGESALEDLLEDLINAQDKVTLATYAGFGEVTLRLSVKCKKDEDPQQYFRLVEPEVMRRIDDHLYTIGNETLPQIVAKLLIERRRTVAFAESCTGGMIASELVAVPGISKALLEGCVCYSNEAKVRTLGVKQETLEAHGAVSEQCAREMCEGMKERCGSDFAISVTGIAGPDGGSDEKPVGTVYIGIAGPEGTSVQKFQFGRDRQRVRRMSALNALDILRRALL